jgi:hypothetical protein
MCCVNHSARTIGHYLTRDVHRTAIRHSRASGNLVVLAHDWVPAFAGTTKLSDTSLPTYLVLNEPDENSWHGEFQFCEKDLQ